MSEFDGEAGDFDVYAYKNALDAYKDMKRDAALLSGKRRRKKKPKKSSGQATGLTWCRTTVRILHPDAEALELFQDRLEDWLAEGRRDMYGRLGWLDEWGDVNFKGGTRCRGTIDDIALVDGGLTLVVVTARRPILGMLLRLIDAEVPGASLTYMAENAETGLYLTNDPDVAGRWNIDCRDDMGFDLLDRLGIYDCRAVDENEAVGIMRAALGSGETDVGRLLVELRKGKAGKHISVNRWEYEDAEAF